jgi:hypothetical protein
LADVTSRELTLSVITNRRKRALLDGGRHGTLSLQNPKVL